MVTVSDYQIGAFEALKWTWHILRDCDERPNGLDDARSVIRETLFKLGKGDIVQFNNYLLEHIANEESTTSLLVPDC